MAKTQELNIRVLDRRNVLWWMAAAPMAATLGVSWPAIRKGYVPPTIESISMEEARRRMGIEPATLVRTWTMLVPDDGKHQWNLDALLDVKTTNHGASCRLLSWRLVVDAQGDGLNYWELSGEILDFHAFGVWGEDPKRGKAMDTVVTMAGEEVACCGFHFQFTRNLMKLDGSDVQA